MIAYFKQMNFKYINFLLAVVLFILLFSCAHKIDCYQASYCQKKYKIFVFVQNRDSQNISVILKNNSSRRIGPIDSLQLVFYRFNMNLRQPIHDSILASTDKFIMEVNYDQPIIFYSTSYLKSEYIKGGRELETELPLNSLLNSIRKFGSKDNELQIKSEFQIFWIGFRNGKMVYHLPSSFFKIKNKNVVPINREIKVRFDN